MANSKDKLISLTKEQQQLLHEQFRTIDKYDYNKFYLNQNDKSFKKKLLSLPGISYLYQKFKITPFSLAFIFILFTAIVLSSTSYYINKQQNVHHRDKRYLDITKTLDRFPQLINELHKDGLDASGRKNFNIQVRNLEGNETEVHVNTLKQCLSNIVDPINKLANISKIDSCPDKTKINVDSLLVFIFTALFLGVLARIITFTMEIPFTVLLLVIGLTISVFCKFLTCYLGCTMYHISKIIDVTNIQDLDGHLILQIFLPVLLFESAYDIDSHLFVRSIGEILLLAIPALLIATSLTSLFAWWWIPEFQDFDSISTVILFGALISATDPVAVVSLLKEIGGNKVLSTIIEGEALLNDGAAIIVFKIALNLANIEQYTSHGSHSSHDQTGHLLDNSTNVNDTLTDTQTLNAYYLMTELAQNVVMPVALGYGLALTSSKILTTVFDDMLVEVSFPLIMCYVSYFIAEGFDGSGVITCVVYGLCLDKNSICVENHEFLHKFFQMLAYLANTIIFLIVGMITVDEFSRIESDRLSFEILLVKAFTFYLVLTVIRFVSISFMYPFMKKKSNFEITFNEITIMTWGGLRGAVSLCLALNIIASDTAPQDYRLLTHKIMMYTVIVVTLTLIINAVSIKWLLDKLGMLKITTSMHQTMNVAIDNLQEATNKCITTYRYDQFLLDSYWPEVFKRTMIEYPYGDVGDEVLDLDEHESKTSLRQRATINDQRTQIKDSVIQRVLKSLKMTYGKQFAEGTISDEAFHVLTTTVNKCVDENRFITVNDLKQHWQYGGIVKKIKNRLEAAMFDDRSKKDSNPWKNRFLRKLYYFVKKPGFDVTMQTVVLLNVFFIALDFHYAELDNKEQCDLEKMENVDFDKAKCFTATEELTKMILVVANIIFFVIYLIEFGLKIIGLGVSQYFADRWNDFDFIILIIGAFDILIIFLSMVIAKATNDGQGTSGTALDNILKSFKALKMLKASKVIRALKILRGLRALRFMKTLIPKTVEFLDSIIHRKMSFGYSIGRCFIRGQDELIKIYPSLIDNKKILEDFTDEAEQNRLDVERELGLIQRDKPGLVTAIKTRTAVQSILNVQRDQVRKFQSGGILDEKETSLLQCSVKKNIQKLNIKGNFPLTIDPPKDLDMIDNIPWVDDNDEVNKYLRQTAEKIDFDVGDILIQQQEEVDGLYIITSGMVKIYGPGMEKARQEKIKKPVKQVDEFTDLDSDNAAYGYIQAGGIVGEIGIMTHKISELTAVCETAVTAFKFDVDVMNEALRIFHQLGSLVWKKIGIDVALNQVGELLELGSTQEQRRKYLEPCYLKDMWANEQFIMDESTNKAILIYGAIKIEYQFDSKNRRLAEDPRFKSKTVYAPALIGHMNDRNYKIIEQTFIPVVDGNTVSPKLLVIPEDRGSSHENIALIERITNVNNNPRSRNSCMVPRGDKKSIVQNLMNSKTKSSSKVGIKGLKKSFTGLGGISEK